MAWATSVPILVFLGLSVLDLDPMYATDRQIEVRRASSLNAPALGRGHNNELYVWPVMRLPQYAQPIASVDL